jgi:hypothetical protein
LEEAVVDKECCELHLHRCVPHPVLRYDEPGQALCLATPCLMLRLLHVLLLQFVLGTWGVLWGVAAQY